MTTGMKMIEEELTKKFKGKYLDNTKFKDAVNESAKKYFVPANYSAKAIIDPYGRRIICVECVKV